MAEQIIYNLQVEGFKSISDVEKALKDINKNLKDVDQTTEEGKKEFAQYSEQQAKLKNALDDSRKGLIENAKAQKAQEGSLDALRLKLSQLTKERNGVPLASARFQELQKELKSTSDEIKAVEEQSGDFRRSVGNYQRAAEGATLGTGKFSSGISGLNSVVRANPIGLLVTAVVLLGDKISNITPLLDNINRVLQPLFTVIERIVGIIQNGLIQAVEAFQKDGVVAGIKAFGAAFEDAGQQISDAADDGARLAEIRIQIEEGEIALIKRQAELNEEIQKNRLIAEDTTKTTQERVEAAEKALSLESEIEDIKSEQLRLQLEEANLKAAQNKTDRVARKEIAEIEAAISTASAERLSKSIELQNKLNALRKEEVTNIKAQRAEIERLRDLEIKQIEDLDKRLLAEEDKEQIAFERRLEAEEARRLEKEQSLINALNQEQAIRDQALNDQVEAERLANEQRIAGEKAYQDFKIRSQEQTLSATANFAGALAGILNEQTIAQKVAASAQAVINTFLGATQALRDPTQPSSIIRLLNAGAIITTGLSALAKINNVKIGGGGGGNGATSSATNSVVSSNRGATTQADNDARFQQAFGNLNFNPRVSVTDIDRVSTRQKVTVTESNL